MWANVSFFVCFVLFVFTRCGNTCTLCCECVLQEGFVSACTEVLGFGGLLTSFGVSFLHFVSNIHLDYVLRLSKTWGFSFLKWIYWAQGQQQNSIPILTATWHSVSSIFFFPMDLGDPRFIQGSVICFSVAQCLMLAPRLICTQRHHKAHHLSWEMSHVLFLCSFMPVQNYRSCA